MYFLFGLLIGWVSLYDSPVATTPPNVILIITDDQGIGDFGFSGNPHVKTPNLDQLASESIRFNQFYVSPVCAPTRSSLMTGRYSLRTGIRDTYNGGAMMASNEVTIAEMLQQEGYQTGIFGKWHLGDNYPSRPIDQGFDESVIHLAGGMGQVGDITTFFRKDSSYFDPVLWHNGQKEQYQGYCSDVFAENALQFIEKNKDKPFFCYLSFNAPHTPLQVPQEYYDKYANIDPTTQFNSSELPNGMTDRDKEDARKVYAMVENIDDNIGALMAKLDQLNIRENTLLIFLTDNGPQQRRYVKGLRGRKGSVYQGGVNVPFLVSWPEKFTSGRTINEPAAHIDVLPTIASLCNVSLPMGRLIDGKNLTPLMENKTVGWSGRPLFFHWTRKYPELYRNIALIKDGHKLVGNAPYNAPITEFELFELEKDPGEQHNLSSKKPLLAKELKYDLDQTFRALIQSPNLLDPPHIVVGHEIGKTQYLNRNDAAGQRGIWSQESVYGYWDVDIQDGVYDITFQFLNALPGAGRMTVESGTLVHHQPISENQGDKVTMKNVYLPQLKTQFIPFFQGKGQMIFPFWVEIKRVK